MFSHNFKVNISNILKHKGRWTSYMLKTTSKIMNGDKDGLLYYTIFISSIYINFPVWYCADNPSTFSNTYWWQNINYFFTVSVYLSVLNVMKLFFSKMLWTCIRCYYYLHEATSSPFQHPYSFITIHVHQTQFTSFGKGWTQIIGVDNVCSNMIH